MFPAYKIGVRHLALIPPHGGLVPPQPNANPLTFAPEKDRLLKVAEAVAYCHVSRTWIDAALTTKRAPTRQAWAEYAPDPGTGGISPKLASDKCFFSGLNL